MGRRRRGNDTSYSRWLLSGLVRWLWLPALGGAAGLMIGGPWIGLFLFLTLLVGLSLAITILEYLV